MVEGTFAPNKRGMKHFNTLIFCSVRSIGALTARFGAVHETFVDVPYDIWRHFSVIDWGARGRRGRRWADTYSVHIKKIGSGEPFAQYNAPLPDHLTITAAMETACLRWLSVRMREAPHSPASKLEMWEEASSKFRGLARKAFDRSWTKAIESTGAVDWKRPGPRRRS